MAVSTLDTRARYSPGLLALPFILLIIIYLPALIDLVGAWWTDGNYSHGFLIPLVSAWLLWKKRDELKEIATRVDSRGLIIVALGMLLFVFANGGAEYFTLRVSFVVTLFGLVFYLFGAEMIRRTWFPILFLVFMMPIPYVVYFKVAFPMQLLASKITSSILNAIGMSVVRQGNIIHIPGYSLEVAEACSGMRSLMALLALGALFAYTTQKRLSAQIILFLATLPLAVIGNVFRVFITSLLAYTVTTGVTEEPLHSIMGLIVFLVAFVGLFIFGAILKKVYRD